MCITQRILVSPKSHDHVCSQNVQQLITKHANILCIIATHTKYGVHKLDYNKVKGI